MMGYINHLVDSQLAMELHSGERTVPDATEHVGF